MKCDRAINQTHYCRRITELDMMCRWMIGRLVKLSTPSHDRARSGFSMSSQELHR